jgi:hypothetical protein
MYQARLIVQVKAGRFKEHLEILEKMNDLVRSRGWTESTYYIPTVGVGNQFIAVTEYPDLGTFEREGDAFFSDREAMALVKDAVDCIVDGSVRSELFQTISTAEAAALS